MSDLPGTLDGPPAAGSPGAAASASASASAAAAPSKKAAKPKTSASASGAAGAGAGAAAGAAGASGDAKARRASTGTSASGKPRKKTASSAESGAEAGDAGLIGSTELPRAAREIMTILRAMNVQEHEPLVVAQLIEFTHRYMHDVLQDAQRFADHRNSQTISKDDVKLAIASRAEFTGSAPPPREFLMELAMKKNVVPLPAVTDKAGIRLPTERFCLLNPNFVVTPSTKARAPPKVGPWDLPASQAAVAAAEAAKEHRKRRRITEQALKPAEVVSGSAAMDTDVNAQTLQTNAQAAEDNYDD